MQLGIKYPPVTFTYSQRNSINSTICEVTSHYKWILHALNVRIEHVHVVITAMKLPEQILNSLKSWCTRRMREDGLWRNKFSPWSRHGSTRYLWNEKEINDACKYVLYGQK
jgi:REP element-mobilizing transposase RayT